MVYNSNNFNNSGRDSGYRIILLLKDTKEEEGTKIKFISISDIRG
jgi:hypothetical protein